MHGFTLLFDRVCDVARTTLTALCMVGARFRRGRPSGKREARKAGKGAMRALKAKSSKHRPTARQSHQRVPTMAKTWCQQNQTLTRRCDA